MSEQLTDKQSWVDETIVDISDYGDDVILIRFKSGNYVKIKAVLEEYHGHSAEIDSTTKLEVYERSSIGLISEEEANAILQAEKRAHDDKEANWERAQFERLKVKFEGSPAPAPFCPECRGRGYVEATSTSSGPVRMGCSCLRDRERAVE